MPTSRLATGVTVHAAPGRTAGRFNGRASNMAALAVDIELAEEGVDDPGGWTADPQPASSVAKTHAITACVTCLLPCRVPSSSIRRVAT